MSRFASTLKALVISSGSVVLACPVAAQPPPAPVEKTAQTQCWDESGTLINCPGTGQDGEWQAGVDWPDPRFQDGERGEILDNLTGLVWLKDASCSELGPGGTGEGNWQQALDAANGLADGLCGLSDGSVEGDWRLPNVRELRSLIDFNQGNPALPLEHPFVGVESHHYWSSTTHVNFTIDAWLVMLGGGFVGDIEKNEAYFVWPVRDGPATMIPAAPVEKTGQTNCWDEQGAVISCAGTGQDGDIQAGVDWPVPRFGDLGDGAIVDHLTGLVWLKDAGCFDMQTWQETLEAVMSLAPPVCNLNDGSIAGLWRLPNEKELQSLIDFGRTFPALPSGHPFIGIQWPYYWSSTTRRAHPVDALSVTPDYGGGNPAPKWHLGWAWPLRRSFQIFSDGFESGDTSAWSSSVP